MWCCIWINSAHRLSSFILQSTKLLLCSNALPCNLPWVTISLTITWHVHVSDVTTHQVTLLKSRFNWLMVRSSTFRPTAWSHDPVTPGTVFFPDMLLGRGNFPLKFQILPKDCLPKLFLIIELLILTRSYLDNLFHFKVHFSWFTTQVQQYPGTNDYLWDSMYM